MVKILMGLKGMGKTKNMIELVNTACLSEAGVTVCMERGQKLRFDVKREVRLVDTEPYDIRSYQVLRGFITGLYAGNFDITHIFIDSLFKVSGESDMENTERFIKWAAAFGEQNGISFTVSISEDAAKATEEMKKYM